MHNKTILLPTLNGVPWWFFYKIGGKFNNYQIQSVDPNNYQWNFLSPSRVIGAVAAAARGGGDRPGERRRGEAEGAGASCCLGKEDRTRA